ncbi:MAG: hypothetical protein WCR30_05040 [Clostridia bacterium]
MAKNTTQGFDIWLVLIIFFFGWLGIDKLYKGGGWKLALVKFLLNLVIVGEIWNIYDFVCAIMGRYKLNPLK